MNHIAQHPLVSVVIITYNSAKTVIETLESVSRQTYDNIELIVTDDGSKDDTTSIVSDWIASNRKKFIRAAVLTVEKNTGTVRNLNRGILESSGVWIKSLAGDDCLVPNCIEKFVKFIQETNCSMCCCDLELFSSTPNNDMDVLRAKYDYYFSTVKYPLQKQWAQIQLSMTIPGPGWFYSRELYDEIKGFDEKYILAEEAPFLFRVLQNHHKIEAVEGRLVKYRIDGNSLCHHSNKRLGNKVLAMDTISIFRDLQRPALLRSGKFLTAWQLTITFRAWENMHKYGEKSIQSKLVNILYLLSPRFYADIVLRAFRKSGKTSKS